jgi:hypothetical protein
MTNQAMKEMVSQTMVALLALGLALLAVMFMGRWI